LSTKFSFEKDLHQKQEDGSVKVSFKPYRAEIKTVKPLAEWSRSLKERAKQVIEKIPGVELISFEDYISHK